MAFEQWLWLLRFYTLLAAQYNIVLRLVMSAIIILQDENGDYAVFMPGTLLPPSWSHDFPCQFVSNQVVGPGCEGRVSKRPFGGDRPIWGQSRLETSRRPKTFTKTIKHN